MQREDIKIRLRDIFDYQAAVRIDEQITYKIIAGAHRNID